MNPQAQTTSIEQAFSLSYRLTRNAFAVGVLAVLAVNGLGCGIEPGGSAEEEATSLDAVFTNNPWSTSWTAENPTTSTVTDDGGLTRMHYQSSSATTSMAWMFRTQAPADADVFFTWDYSGLHEGSQAHARVVAFAAGPNGLTTIRLLGTPDQPQPVSGSFAFSNKYDTALRVYEGYKYGFLIAGDHADGLILQGDLNVQYRAEKIVKSIQFGGQLWPASPGQFSNIEQIAPPGEFIREVRVYWNDDVIRGVSWAYSDDSCVHAGPCMIGNIGATFPITGWKQWTSKNITFNSSERLGSCTIRDSGFGYRSLRELELKKHPALDATRTTTVTFGPDGFDSERTTDTDGDYLVGFYGVYNNDGFFASIGLITRKPQ